MPGADNAVQRVQQIICEALEQDYAKYFAPRYASASRVRKGKIPIKPVDELRNAVDHLARAILLATAADAGPTAPIPMIGDEEIKGDPLVDAARGRRHLASGDFQSLYYIATWRLKDLKDRLASDLIEKMPDLEKVEEELDELLGALSKMDLPRATEGILDTSMIDGETQRTIGISSVLEDLVVRINSLWGRVELFSRGVRS